jgi:hypothetical protein
MDNKKGKKWCNNEETRCETTKERHKCRKPTYKNGYKLIYCPNYPIKTKLQHGKIKEHVLVMESKLGRILEKNEFVFHKDGNLLNNDINNLYVKKTITRSIINENELVEKRKSGIGVRQLVEEYKISWSLIYRILKEYDLVNKNIKIISSKKIEIELEFLEDWNK